MTLARVAVGALVIAFLWAAGAKFARYARWRKALARYRLPHAVEVVAAPLVPLVEIAAVGLLLAGWTRAGAALVLMMLGAFSMALSRARSLVGDRVPCGCFGGDGERDFGALMTRNALLAFATVPILRAGRDVAVFDGVALPRAGEILPALLVVVGLILVAVMVVSVARPRVRDHGS